MHGGIGPALEHRHFQFLEEQALAADLRQRPVDDAVAARCHRHQLDLESGMRSAQPGGDMFGLPEGECALAGGQSEGLHPAIIADFGSSPSRNCAGPRL